MREKIGLIGFGNMGSAIFERAKDTFDFMVYEKDPAKTGKLPPEVVAQDLCAMVSQADAVVIAIKPQDFSGLLKELKPGGAAIISIAAGIPIAFIEAAIPDARVIRVMPNLAAKVGKGMTCIAKGRKAAQPDLTLAERLFKKVGQVLVIDESLMDAATAVSGSGPGFFFELVAGKSLHEAQNFGKHMFTPELAAAAVQIGFTPQQASVLASMTTTGALALLKETGVSAQELRDRVTSKGGTTAAGLEALRKTGELRDAACAALARAKELSKG